MFWDVTQRSSQRNGCSRGNNIPFHCTGHHSFRSIFKKVVAPNSPFETCPIRDLFYLPITWWKSHKSTISLGGALRDISQNGCDYFRVTCLSLCQNVSSWPGLRGKPQRPTPTISRKIGYCEQSTIHMKICSAYRFILVEVKPYFHTKDFARGTVSKLRQ